MIPRVHERETWPFHGVALWSMAVAPIPEASRLGAKPSRRRRRSIFSLIAAIFGALFIVAHVDIDAARADSGYEHYAPAVAKEFPPGYATCKDCQSKLDRLNAAINELNAFDQQHPSFRDVYPALSDTKAAEKALDDLNSQPKPKGDAGKKYDADVSKAKKDLNAAKANEKAAKDAMKKGGPNGTPPPDPSDVYKLQAELDDILSKIKTWSDALRDCLPRCKEKEEGR
jgi:hypothetical protein